MTNKITEEREGGWLIHKAGRGWYRPNAQGYTNDTAQAGRYSHADAHSYSHPNGWDGPRDGITITHESQLQSLRSAQAGEVEVVARDPWVDTRIVRFDDTIVFGHGGFDFDRWESLRWEMHTKHGSFAVWKSGDRTWSMYGGKYGVLALDRYVSEDHAKADAEEYVLSLDNEPDLQSALAAKDAEIAELRETIRLHKVWDFPADIQALTLKLEAAEARANALQERVNHCRAAFAGMVSVQSAIDLLDAPLHLNGAKP